MVSGLIGELLEQILRKVYLWVGLFLLHFVALASITWKYSIENEWDILKRHKWGERRWRCGHKCGQIFLPDFGEIFGRIHGHIAIFIRRSRGILVHPKINRLIDPQVTERERIPS